MPRCSPVITRLEFAQPRPDFLSHRYFLRNTKRVIDGARAHENWGRVCPSTQCHYPKKRGAGPNLRRLAEDSPMVGSVLSEDGRVEAPSCGCYSGAPVCELPAPILPHANSLERDYMGIPDAPRILLSLSAGEKKMVVSPFSEEEHQVIQRRSRMTSPTFSTAHHVPPRRRDHPLRAEWCSRQSPGRRCDSLPPPHHLSPP